MKYIIENFVETNNGATYHKWLPESDLSLMAENLLDLMKGGRSKVHWLATPFVLTLCAALEAKLNDWLITDTFKKHGFNDYQRIVAGYLSAKLQDKMRTTVAVLTNGTFQIDEESCIITTLDKLIRKRNKVTHPRVYFYTKVTRFKRKPKRQQAWDHPLHTFTLRECRDYFKAFNALDRKFFFPYELDKVKENDLIAKTKNYE